MQRKRMVRELGEIADTGRLEKGQGRREEWRVVSLEIGIGGVPWFRGSVAPLLLPKPESGHVHIT